MSSPENPRERPIQIAVVGDVHDRWDETDASALKNLGVDLVLFVGDFGNESVSVVRTISQLDLPKATIFGNHDAWYTATPWGRKRCPYQRPQEDWLQEQLDLLEDVRVGYRALDFPELQLSVVGSRPFSWGGSTWKRYRDFYREWFGVTDLEDSIERIVSAAKDATYDRIIFLGHNGPTGLGDLPEDPCGKDWEPIGGDHGDPDFEAAITRVREIGKTIPLVTFGHMHHNLRHTKTQQRRTIDIDRGTIYLNSARVPRTAKDGKWRSFTLVSMTDTTISQISLAWVDASGRIADEKILYGDRG
ncbi:MAG: TIGR04168 family protein [Cyanobacteriota bacterium]|nr:TIGR04168 family protein [Cyanobacteriota bacterium]